MRRRIAIVAMQACGFLFATLAIGGLGYAAAPEAGSAQADQYSTTSTTGSTSTSTSTTTPTSTSTSTSTTTSTTSSTSTTTSTSTSTSTSTTTSTTTSTSSTSAKPGKGCGDKNHLHERRFECKVVISDVQSKEGKSGTTAFVFVVSLAGNPLAPVTVDYASAAGTASAPSDFQVASGTLTFPIGVNVRTVTISVLGDTVRELNELFYLNLSNPSANAYIDDGQGVATIVNDD